MIISKQDLHHYLEADALAANRKVITPKILGDECWKFQYRLRHTEYYYNNKKRKIHFLLYCISKFLLHHISVRLGFSVSLNCIGPGLFIPHRGTIVINDKAKIGKNCRIHVCVNIGEGTNHKAPTIGDNVYIGPGAKIFGDIYISDNVIIGANAVVNRSIDTPGISVGGIPAKPLKQSKLIIER
jgi:serine O-acetyltransferase